MAAAKAKAKPKASAAKANAAKASAPAETRSPHAWIEEPGTPPPAWSQAPPPQGDGAPPPGYVVARPFDEKQYTLFLHLSALGGFLLGGLFFVGPLVMWLVKKEQSAFVDRHGRAALDFHISLVIYAAIAFVAFLVITIATLGIGVLLLIPVIILLSVAAVAILVVFPILAGIKASRGEEASYPLSLRLLRRVEDIML